MTLTAINLNYKINDAFLLEDLSFELKKGEVMQVKGANGSGKTTLLSLICGFSKLNSGKILYKGESLDSSSFYQHELGYLGHKLGLHESLTVTENLNFIREIHHRSNDLNEVLREHRLIKYRDYYLKELSQGLKKRVSLSLLTLLEKSVWLLDEPYAALDLEAQSLLTSVLSQLKEKGAMIILSSHQSFDLNIDQVISLS